MIALLLIHCLTASINWHNLNETTKIPVGRCELRVLYVCYVFGYYTNNRLIAFY